MPSRALESSFARQFDACMCGSKRVSYIVAGEVVYGALSKHAVVLELGLAERRSVASDDNQLGLAGAQLLQCGLVAECDLARLHNVLVA